MNKTTVLPKEIQVLKDKLESVGLEFQGENCGDPLTWIGDLFIHGVKRHKVGKEILDWLDKELEFKFVEAVKKDDFEGGFSVISLKGKLYRLDYEFGSSEEIGYCDFFSWKPVSAKEKVVKVYE